MFGQDLSDANLFRRVRRGDTRSFGVLIHRHDPTLRRLASRLLAEPDQIDPVLHKAYTKTWRTAAMARLGSGRDAVRNWLYRVVYNTCVDELRRQPPHSGPTPFTGPRVRLPNTSVERRLSALRALSPGERIPLVLVDSEGFDIRSAARILQRKPTEVAADLAAARRRWRDLVIGPPDAGKPEASEEQEPLEQGSLQPGETESAATAADSAEPAAKAGVEQAVSSPDGLAPPENEKPATIRIGSGNGAKPSEPATPTRVAHALEGAFDSQRFTRLKQWFKSKSTDGDLDDLGTDGPAEDEPEEMVVAPTDERVTVQPDARDQDERVTVQPDARDQSNTPDPQIEPKEDPPPKDDNQPTDRGEGRADDGEPDESENAQEAASADRGASS